VLALAGRSPEGMQEVGRRRPLRRILEGSLSVVSRPAIERSAIEVGWTTIAAAVGVEARKIQCGNP
jgi:predicted regulator of amino acid metabolism with ACT domain